MMNTSSLMDRLPHTYLLIFCCFTFVCINGKGQDSSPSCEVELMVQRGTTWKTAPHRHLTVTCPVRHCGESLSVTWCKLLDTNKYEQISNTENVKIRQKDTPVKDELISYLTFKRISVRDDGLYICRLKGYKYEEISHIINISVSDLNKGQKNSDDNADLNQEVKNSDNKADESPGVPGDEDVSWLSFFSVCVGIALLVAALTLLCFYGWKRILTYNHTKGQEMSTHMIPDLPNGSAPSPLVLQAHLSALNDIYLPSTAERPPSQPPLMTYGNQPAVANTADGSQETSDRAVYAIVNHRQSGILVREQHAESLCN